MKTKMPACRRRHFGFGAFAALRMALACAAAAGTFPAIANTPPTAQDLFNTTTANVNWIRNYSEPT